MRSPLLLTAALVAALALTGCGGDTAPSAATPTDDANNPPPAAASEPAKAPARDVCKLLTDAEVADLFGTAATVDEKKNPVRDCVWTVNKNGLHQLHVQIYTGKSYYDPKRWGGTPEAVSGLGDEAFLIRKAGLGSTVGVLDGDTAVFVNYQIMLIRDPNPGAKADTLITLARAVLDRL